MLRRFAAAAATAGAITALGLSGSAVAAGSLPTINIALNGAKGISVSGTPVSGAVAFSATTKGTLPKGSQGFGFGIFRLNPGATIGQAVAAVKAQHGDLNALDPYGALIVDASAPGTTETVLTSGNYVALNISGQGQPAFASFTVAKASSPATLPKANATETAIEFTFRGPRVLHNGWMVRAQNQGYLVHMVALVGVKSKAAGLKAIALLRAGKDNKAFKYTNGSFVDLAGPLSTGGMQQEVLHAKPGWYIEACFMDTQDRREHTRLGMERLVRIK